MVSIAALWMPIILSAVLVFLASSVIHMMLPWHKKDCADMPDQDKAMSALRSLNLAPGDYMVPKPTSMADMKSEAFIAKAKQGPRVLMTVLPPWTGGMGRELGLWFVFNLAVSVYAAYLAGTTLAAGTPYLRVFQVAGATAFACYAMGLWPATIWFRKSMRFTLNGTFDGLIYALLTAGTFGWLWPKT